MVELVQNLISNLPVVFKNAAGDIVGPPSGAAPSVSISDGAAGAVTIGSDGTSIDFLPTQPPAPGGGTATITALFNRADGRVITVAEDFTIGAAASPPDNEADSGAFNTDGITTRPLQ